MVQIGLQLDEQAVVNGTPNGEQHLVLPDVPVNSTEGASWTRSAAVGVESGIETVACVIGDLRTFRNRTVDGCSVKSAAAAKRCVGGRNGGLRVCGIQEARITNLVGIQSEEIVRGHVANIVHADGRVLGKLALNSGIDLQRTRRNVVGSQHLDAIEVVTLQSGPNEVGVRTRAL